uniref:Neural_ProG_Cyt domain-containing protein n=1 Tax=Parastrongyloides trichosuri TaxID=131310 RepID=A0A0N4Z4V8_PARTI
MSTGQLFFDSSHFSAINAVTENDKSFEVDNSIGSQFNGANININNINSNSGIHPFSSYKPITWDKYYATEFNEKPASLTSGVAAGVTIGVFFAVFLLTFGCRLYSSRVDENERGTSSSQERSTLSSATCGLAPCERAWICTDPRDPPPPYEVAITMPKEIPDTVLESPDHCDLPACAVDRDALGLRLSLILPPPPPATPEPMIYENDNTNTN